MSVEHGSTAELDVTTFAGTPRPDGGACRSVQLSSRLSDQYLTFYATEIPELIELLMHVTANACNCD